MTAQRPSLDDLSGDLLIMLGKAKSDYRDRSNTELLGLINAVILAGGRHVTDEGAWSFSGGTRLMLLRGHV